MAPEVFLRREIANAMCGTYQAIVQTAIVTSNTDMAFHAGVRTALAALAVTFGISPADVMPEMWEMTLAQRGRPPRLENDGS